MGKLFNVDGKLCIGMTYVEVEAHIILMVESAKKNMVKVPEGYLNTVESLVENRILKRCSKHPDHFITTTWQDAADRTKARKIADLLDGEGDV